MNLFNKPVAMICVALAATVAHAEEAALDFNIQHQPVSQVLDALAKQTGLQFVYADRNLKGIDSPGVTGRYALRESVARALAGTGLTYQFTAEKTVAIRPVAVAAKLAAEPEELNPVTVTATRTERRLDEVPASVTVITARDIAAQRAVTVSDLLRNLEGVDVKSNAAGGSGMVMLRGMGGSFAGQTTQVLVDGMPIEPVVLAPKGAALDIADLGDIERVEVVRGPATVLYGPSAMGGVVNILTKRGSGALRGEAELGLGSHNARSLRAAASGGSDKVDFRISASDYRTDGFIAEPTPYFWQQQDLTGRDWRQRKYGVSLGFYPADNQELTFAVRNYFTDAAWLGGRPNYRWNRDGTYYDLGYKVELSSSATLKFKYLSSTIKENLSWDGLPVNGDPADFTRYMAGQRNEYGDAFEVQSNLRLTPGQLLTVGLSHSVGRQVETEDTAVPLSSIAGWDYFAYNDTGSKTKVTGLYAQDEISVSDNTLINIGGRYDRFKLYGNTRYDWDNYGTNTLRIDPDSTDGIFNPRLGVRHKLAEHASVYASYGTAYQPSLNGLRYRANATCNSPDLKSERSESYEMGFNGDLSGLSAKVAIFHTNYKGKIEGRRSVFCTQYINVGAVAVDGLELAIEKRSGSALRPYLNYTYNDSRIIGNPNNQASVGTRLNLVARQKLNAGVIYDMAGNTTVRLGGRYVGDRYFDVTMTNQPGSRAPGYFVADFKVIQRIPLGAMGKDAELSLAINNLFDRKFIEQKGYANGGLETFREYGDGRNVWLNLSARF
jgi:outer membrane receptor protein involved in Fe transport